MCCKRYQLITSNPSKYLPEPAVVPDPDEEQRCSQIRILSFFSSGIAMGGPQITSFRALTAECPSVSPTGFKSASCRFSQLADSCKASHR